MATAANFRLEEREGGGRFLSQDFREVGLTRPTAREDGRQQHVQEAVHLRLHAVVVGADGMVQSGGELDDQAFAGGSGQGGGDLLDARKGGRGHAAGAELETERTGEGGAAMMAEECQQRRDFGRGGGLAEDGQVVEVGLGQSFDQACQHVGIGSGWEGNLELGDSGAGGVLLAHRAQSGGDFHDFGGEVGGGVGLCAEGGKAKDVFRVELSEMRLGGGELRHRQDEGAEHPGLLAVEVGAVVPQRGLQRQRRGREEAGVVDSAGQQGAQGGGVGGHGEREGEKGFFYRGWPWRTAQGATGRRHLGRRRGRTRSVRSAFFRAYVRQPTKEGSGLGMGASIAFPLRPPTCGVPQGVSPAIQEA